jgi:large subunit ribosomal protein L10
MLSLNRTEKEKQVAWLRDQFLQAKGLFLTDFQGLTVAEMTKLRAELRKTGISFKVLKNTLARLAYQDTDVAAVGPDLAGPRAAAWTDTEEKMVSMAKVLMDFAKGHPKFGLIGGVLNGKRVAPTQLEALATLPPRDVLLGRLLGTMIAPVSAFVNTLAAIPRSFLYVLKAIEEQKGAAAEPAEG